jgi:hypothetical protein
MDAGRRPRRTLKFRRAADMVDVRVRVKDRPDHDTQRVESRAEGLEVPAGVNHNGALGLEVRHDGAVALEWAHSQRFDVHDYVV